MSIFYKISRDTPSQCVSDAKLLGIWIVTCRYLILDEILYLDRDFYEDPDLYVWDFSPSGGLFIQDNEQEEIVYLWNFDNGLLHIEPEYGGRFGKAGDYIMQIVSDEALLSRIEPVRPGSRFNKETECYRFVRYRGSDISYRELKELHYREARDAGGKEFFIDWEKQRLYEEERKYFERMCEERGWDIMFDEEEDDD